MQDQWSKYERDFLTIQKDIFFGLCMTIVSFRLEFISSFLDSKRAPVLDVHKQLALGISIAGSMRSHVALHRSQHDD